MDKMLQIGKNNEIITGLENMSEYVVEQTKKYEGEINQAIEGDIEVERMEKLCLDIHNKCTTLARVMYNTEVDFHVYNGDFINGNNNILNKIIAYTRLPYRSEFDDDIINKLKKKLNDCHLKKDNNICDTIVILNNRYSEFSQSVYNQLSTECAKISYCLEKLIVIFSYLLSLEERIKCTMRCVNYINDELK